MFVRQLSFFKGVAAENSSELISLDFQALGIGFYFRMLGVYQSMDATSRSEGFKKNALNLTEKVLCSLSDQPASRTLTKK
jgi:hypothetical protein